MKAKATFPARKKYSRVLLMWMIFFILCTGGGQAWAEPGSFGLGGLVWEDVKQNGTQEGPEPNVAGAHVTLYDEQGNILQETLTDQNGIYRFDGLGAGTYQIEVATQLSVKRVDGFRLNGSNFNFGIGLFQDSNPPRSVEQGTPEEPEENAGTDTPLPDTSKEPEGTGSEGGIPGVDDTSPDSNVVTQEADTVPEVITPANPTPGAGHADSDPLQSAWNENGQIDEGQANPDQVETGQGNGETSPPAMTTVQNAEGTNETGVASRLNGEIYVLGIAGIGSLVLGMVLLRQG